jgi:hypothetical protein
MKRLLCVASYILHDLSFLETGAWKNQMWETIIRGTGIDKLQSIIRASDEMVAIQPDLHKTIGTCK